MEGDYEPISIGRDDLEDDDLVGLLQAASGGLVMLPMSLRRLDGDQVQSVADVQHAAAAVSRAQAVLDAAVREARQLDVSWSAIAWSTGLSDRGAAKRWGSDD